MADPPREPDDEALLFRAGQGDRGALAAFWERRAREGMRLALLLTRDRILAEEALQEAWLGVHRAAPSFDPAKGSARGWFLGIVRHKVGTLARQARRRPLSLDRDLPAGDPAPGQPTPGENLLRHEEVEALLAEIAPDLREAVMGRWILGWSDEVMAEAFGISREAAKQRAHRGILALREAVRRKR